MKPEDAAEQYAESVKPSRYGDYFDTRYSEDAFLAGHAHAVKEFQSIWKKPSERPEDGSHVVAMSFQGFRGLQPVEIECGTNGTTNHWESEFQRHDVRYWCYLSDFLKTLPSFGTEEK